MVDSVGQRFMQLIQHLGMSKNAFAMSLDKTATVIQHLVDERNKPGFDLMRKVFEVYPNVSKDWLLMGEGPMLRNDTAAASTATVPPVPAPVVPAKPLEVPVTPSFPAPLFSVSSARLAGPAATVPAQPAEAELPRAPAAEPQALPAAPAATEAPLAFPLPEATVNPGPAPSPAPPATPPATPDAAYLTAALHAQHLQHQLALAEQRNQHLLEQQALMQQMLNLLQRPS